MSGARDAPKKENKTMTRKPNTGTTPALAYLDEVIASEHSNLTVDMRRVHEAMAKCEKYRSQGELALELHAARKVAEAAAEMAKEAARIEGLIFHRECIERAEKKAGNL